jgi:hypothetical protein
MTSIEPSYSQKGTSVNPADHVMEVTYKSAAHPSRGEPHHVDGALG